MPCSRAPRKSRRYVERSAWALGRKHRWITPLCKRAFRRFGSSLTHADRASSSSGSATTRGIQRLGRASNAARRALLSRSAADGAAHRRARRLRPAFARDDRGRRGVARHQATELDWFADMRGMNSPEGPLCHYRYAWMPKRHGMRLMEIPKARLMRDPAQDPARNPGPVPVHAAAHGFLRGRSCRTYVEPHVGRDVVLRLDLRNFFPGIPGSASTRSSRPWAIPRRSPACSPRFAPTQVPMSLARRGGQSWEEAKRLGVPHLPQGAPTSPALANLCALHLDLRLEGLAKELDGELHALCRRHRDLRRRATTQARRCRLDAGLRDRRRGRLRGESSQDARDAPQPAPVAHGNRRQREGQRSPRRIRPPEGDPHQLHLATAPKARTATRGAIFARTSPGRVAHIASLNRSEGRSSRRSSPGSIGAGPHRMAAVFNRPTATA